MNLKEVIKQIKEKFAAPGDTTQVPGNQAPTDSVGTPIVYTLQDGTQIAIQQAGALPAPGDTVTIAGAPAPEGILVLQDGSTITCDATGKVTLYTPVGGDPVTAPATDASQTTPPAMPAKAPVPGVPGKSGYSDQDMAALVSRFDSTTGDDLMTTLVTCVKALMQSEFGWQILEQKRLADTNQAIVAYQNNLQSLQAASQKFTAIESENAQLKATIAKHEQTMKDMFEVMEKLAEMPVTDPKTLNSVKKEDGDSKRLKAEARFKKIADDLKKVRAQA